ncbi:hypothetical protein CAL29_21900 [Bordetella genomosp. 10]|uniref:Secretin/TonB short N-terminal domain-containing protein n=1 Tax=Bordetella genomosp. 10 TaxID=1416804 RepID=A0A261S2D8_9BORD|nr:TonB-dependent siderophore receptor [Bordetella genomosp. 10]OZI30653.1 hypothetical protein CAL29_21900 [Bordetella genomosp. 10]
MTLPLPAARAAGRRRRAALPALLTPLAFALSLGLMSVPVLAHAQDATVEINLPRQSLSDALLQLGQQTSLQFLYASDLVRGLPAPAVTGRYTPEQALRELLRGSPITYTRQGNTIRLSRVASSADLPEVSVTGSAVQESAWGPVDGYVAQRSASGTKTDTPLIETPQSISVVTRDQMDAQGATSINQAVRYSASTVTDSNGADTRATLATIRGFIADEYLDGLPLVHGTFVNSLIDPYMLERVEVVRGPASMLYGQVTPGGIVSYVGKRPTEDPLHEIQLQTGNYGRIGGGFDFSGPVDTDKRWLYRVTGIAFNTGTQVDRARQSRIDISPSLTFRPDADTSFTLLANYRNDPHSGFWNKLPAQGTLLHNPQGRISDSMFTGDLGFDRTSNREASVGYEFRHAFNSDWTFKQNVRYTNMSFAFDSVQGDSLDGTELVRDKFQDRNRLHTFGIDNQLQGRYVTGPVRHDLLFGVNYQGTRARDRETDGLAPSLDISAPDFRQALPAYTEADTYLDNRQTLRQLGVYAQDELALDRWRATLGVRRDWARTSTEDYLSDGATSRQRNAAYTWRAGLLYKFDNGVAPYASYSTSFQPTIGTNAYGAPFKPTTGRQYEIGVKYQPAGSKTLLTAAVYDLRQHDVLTADPNNPYNSVQTGEARSRGVELEAKTDLTPRMHLLASYAYTNATVLKSNSGDEGNRLYGVPLNAFSAWGDYDLTGALAGLNLGMGVRYMGPTYSQNNTLKVPSFTLVDAAIRYDLGRMNPTLKGASVALNVQNLFDRDNYIQACVNGCYYGLRRTVVATLKYRW